MKILLKSLSVLPFFLLYLISDMVYLLLYYIVGYRKKVVRNNISNSFPEKSKKELRTIERKFYRHFCDLIFETMKLQNISEEEMNSRMVFTNKELVADSNKSVLALIGHYGNWEFITSYALHVPKNVVVLQLYKKLTNPFFNDFMARLRERFGSISVESRSALRTFARYKKQGQAIHVGFLADQTPTKNALRYWTTFMNQDTPMIDSGERMARSLGYAMIYLDISRIKRGYYQVEMIPMSTNVADTKEDEMTELYARLLEKSIIRQPELYLWSHKRWKHKRS